MTLALKWHEKDIMFTFTSHQLSIACTFWIVAFLAGIAGSLQAPFYTKEAEAKGISQTNVGLVFAIYHFTIFLMSPIFGMCLGRIGAKRMVDVGIFVMGSCAIGFGTLDYVENSSTFAVMSYVIRAIEAVGHSSFKTATFSVVTKEFPEAVGFMYASLQASFGAGLMIGPFIGGVLYGIGGFVLPFVLIGALTTLSSAVTYIILPTYLNGTTVGRLNNNNSKKGLWGALKVPEILLQATCTLGASISIGFLQATLQGHLSLFNLSDLVIGTLP